MPSARARRYMRTHQSRIDVVRKKPAISHQPPSFSGGMREAVGRRRRLERQPGQLPHELDRIPVHRRQHVEPDDLDGDEAADQRGQPGRRRDRSARSARRRSGRAGGRRTACPGGSSCRVRQARRRTRAPRTWTRVKMFWYSAMTILLRGYQIGRLSHQFHHSGQPRVQNGPLMMMQTALQNAADSARNRPRRWMPSVPIE